MEERKSERDIRRNSYDVDAIESEISYEHLYKAICTRLMHARIVINFTLKKYSKPAYARHLLFA